MEHNLEEDGYKRVVRGTCSIKFANECPVRWESLTGLKDTEDRWCSHCEKKVHRTNDPKKLKELAKNKQCVAVLYEETMLLGDVICMPEPKAQLIDNNPNK